MFSRIERLAEDLLNATDESSSTNPSLMIAHFEVMGADRCQVTLDIVEEYLEVHILVTE